MKRLGMLLCGLLTLTGCTPGCHRAAPSPKTGEPKAAVPPKAAVQKATTPKVTPPKAAGPPSVVFCLAEDKPAKGTRAMTLPGTTEKIHVYTTLALDAKDVESASVERSLWMDREYRVTIALTYDGAQKLEKVTTDNVGKRLAILVGGKAVSAPIIRVPILDGSAVIEGGKMSEQEAKGLAAQINAAARK